MKRTSTWGARWLAATVVALLAGCVASDATPQTCVEWNNYTESCHYGMKYNGKFGYHCGHLHQRSDCVRYENVTTAEESGGVP